mmetsp:Transcript_12305/g.33685  ORF Transcript_12305/g.33685 Transcript_12305/m.33685 type:complete len:240 (+) Transcript_12305:3409-4128(+)
MFLSRTAYAPPHVAVQGVHSSHALHAPSTHSSPHGCKLQAEASPFVKASHAAPPFSGKAWIARFLCIMPPPQLAVQEDQSFHWLQRQSVCGQSPLEPWQGMTSSVPPTQPWLCISSGFLIFRERVLRPCPQSTEQTDHSDHSSRTQSTVQGPVLHAFNSLSELLGQLPPCCGGACIVRVRKDWPPPHSLLHMGGFASLQPKAAHSLHSEIRHGSSFGEGQPCVSFSVWLQRSPPPRAPC